MKSPNATIKLLLISIMLAGTGCASHMSSDWHGPSVPAEVSVESWVGHDAGGQIVRTEHYQIHTSIDDVAFLDDLAQLMEGAFLQYRALAPDVTPSQRPLECYVFKYRPEWAQFTADKTGVDSAVYLQINRGGYTVGDWYVAYYIGDRETFAVAAHEGWHQYVARNFRSRLPPFLEEGIATMFENVQWDGRLPRWNLIVNRHRIDKLREAVRSRHLWPLRKLVTMHAGDVVNLSADEIEAFYAQDWAFANFLMQAENHRYRPAFQKLLSDAAAGTLAVPAGERKRLITGWEPASTVPMLETYLNMDWDAIEAAFNAHVHQLVDGGVSDSEP
jgi:Protein of unknown function (DUF1570)